MRSGKSAKASLSRSPPQTSTVSKKSRSKMRPSNARMESKMTMNSIRSMRRSLLIFCPMQSLASLQRSTISSSLLSHMACSFQAPSNRTSGCNSSLDGQRHSNQAAQQSKEANRLGPKKSSPSSSNNRQALLPHSLDHHLRHHSLSSRSLPGPPQQQPPPRLASLQARPTNRFHSRMPQTRLHQDRSLPLLCFSNRAPHFNLRYSNLC